MLETITLALFSLANTLRIVAYVPQIVCAARDINGASAISFTTWGLFCLSNLSTAAYAAVNLQDQLMVMMFSGNALACAFIVAVTAWKRYTHPVREHMAASASVIPLQQRENSRR